ncbi:hypothetical protein HNR44_000347 [Geomicrobium halophilum]|uniref:Auxin efflux carrier n=1 Tax=Geomicrobium halophilum TaxID=549000 RepID=A0A841PZV6_9BACL|nr:AEC family transporter [Geomicrobium halophilum]MBB6448398.1 hypothetical protein [Geomicrobium halophilum]
MDTATVTLAIATMAVIIILGAGFAFRFPITIEVKQLFMGIIINIAVPSIILNGVFNTELTDEIMQQVLIVFGFSIVFNVFAVFFSFLIGKIFRFQTSMAKKLAILAAFGNSGFIGVPLCATIFGPIGGLLAAVFDAGLDVVLFSVGVYFLQSHGSFDFRHLKAMINAPLIAITAGLLFAISGLNAPVLLQDLTSMLSSIAAPLAMLYIGFLLPPFFQKGQSFIFPQLWFPISMRLLLIPAISVTVITFLPLDHFLQQIFVILTAMPTFMLATVLFSRYTNVEDTSVMTVIYSTILCLGTIPIVVLFANFIS